MCQKDICVRWDLFPKTFCFGAALKLKSSPVSGSVRRTPKLYTFNANSTVLQVSACIQYLKVFFNLRTFFWIEREFVITRDDQLVFVRQLCKPLVKRKDLLLQASMGKIAGVNQDIPVRHCQLRMSEMSVT